MSCATVFFSFLLSVFQRLFNSFSTLFVETAVFNVTVTTLYKQTGFFLSGNSLTFALHFLIPADMRKLKVTEMNRLDVAEFKAAPKLPLVVVLDEVRSLYNVGSVFRTCDAFRVEKICLCGITAVPPHPEIHKTALGAEDSVEWAYFERTEEAVRHLQAEGYVVFSVEQAAGSTKLDKLTLDQGRKYAVILGNEVKGVQQQVVDMSDGCLEIPQFGTKHSLNVSITGGIVIWEFARLLGLFRGKI